MSKQVPSINRLDEYIGAFYDDEIEKKLKATQDIL